MSNPLCVSWEREPAMYGGIDRNDLFRGGTPSRLAADDFARIFNAIEFHFDLSTCREVTFEANPDDLTEAYLRSIRMLPFNRISLGVQSFSNSDLCQLNRRHDRQKAIDTVHRCRKTGLTNISIDLMYGLPGQTTEAWELNLEEAFGLGVPHFSAYHLSYEEGTPLYRAMKKGAVCPVDEDTSALLYSILTEKAKEAGYVHYEISNFCFPGCFSKHNTSYWMGKKYLGVGPSAHSYDGSSRQWNVASLPQYCNALLHNRSYFEQEFPTVPMRYNEYVMTALRTMWELRYPACKTHSERIMYAILMSGRNLISNAENSNKPETPYVFPKRRFYFRRNHMRSDDLKNEGKHPIRLEKRFFCLYCHFLKKAWLLQKDYIPLPQVTIKSCAVLIYHIRM